MSDFLGGKTKDELMEESRKAYKERRQTLHRLAEEQKARELAAMEANKKSETEEIADLIVSVKEEIAQIVPGNAYAMAEILRALHKMAEIVDRVFQQDRQRDTPKQHKDTNL